MAFSTTYRYPERQRNKRTRKNADTMQMAQDECVNYSSSSSSPSALPLSPFLVCGVGRLVKTTAHT